MKPQDIIFIVVLLVVLYKRNPRLSAALGIVCLVVAIPLFHFWIFFTAQRLVQYAAMFILLGITIHLIRLNKV